MKKKVFFSIASIFIYMVFSGFALSYEAEKTLIYSFPTNVGPLNPHLYSPNQMFAQEMVYEGLVGVDKNGKIIPALAKQWEVSPDGLEYRFFLRPDVIFSDTTKFTAYAVVKNFTAVLANAKRHAWLPLTSKVADVTAEAPLIFVLRLHEPYYPTLHDLSLPRPFRMLSPSAFPENDATWEGIKKPVGTGPWKLTKTVLGEYDLFEKNTTYWGELAKVDSVLVKVVPDAISRAVAMKTGEIDLIYGVGQIPFDMFAMFRNDSQYITAISPPVGSFVLALNSGKSPTAELAVRVALQHAVDKATIAKGIFLHTQHQADTLFSPDVPYCDVGLTPYAYDREKAKQILENAGWLLNKGEKIRKKNEQELAMDFFFVGNDSAQKAIGEELQSQFSKVGVRLNLKGEEEDLFLKRQKDGNFDMIVNPTWGPPFEPHAMVGAMLLPAHADYMAQVALPMKQDIDKKIITVLREQDELVRKKLYGDILITLHEQAIYLPLVYFSHLEVHKKGVLDTIVFGAGKTNIPFEQYEKLKNEQ